MEKIRILQLGSEDWNGVYTLPEYVELYYEETLREVPSQPCDLIFLDRTPLKEEIPFLHQSAKAYTLFATDRVKQSEETDWLLRSRKGRYIERSHIQDFLLLEAVNYFPRPYGEKFDLLNLAVSRNFQGRVRWDGKYSVCLTGDFGEIGRAHV